MHEQFFTHDLQGQLIRIVVMYVFVLFILRIAGKRRLAHLSPMDLIIIIALGSAVGDVLIYPQDIVGIANAMVAITSIVALQILMSKISEHSPFMSYILNGKPTLLIKNGRILAKSLDDEDISKEDLTEMLRVHSISKICNVKEAYLERSGDLSVLLMSGKKHRIKKEIVKDTANKI